MFLFFCIKPCQNSSKVKIMQELSDPKIFHLRKIAVSSIVKNKHFDLNKIVWEEIIRDSTQIENGTLTSLTFKIEEKHLVSNCVVKILEQLGNKTTVVHSQCTKIRNGMDLRKKKQIKKKRFLNAFINFTNKFNKVYLSENEYKKRFRIFRANLEKIKVLQEYEKGTAKYGVTKFADLSQKEFQKYLGLRKEKDANQLPKGEIPNIELPNEFDWRQHNAVTSVKNQKACGSCWAFSTTGNVEGQWAIKTGQLLSLSEQELIDCDKKDNGCNGGLMTTAYKEIIKMGGLETETDYPYEATGETCHLKKSEIKVKISGAVNLTTNEDDIAKWVVKHGPVAAAINANAMQFYWGGISHPLKFLCNPKSLNHGVLIVGFGVRNSSTFHEKTLPYWIIKNSWGKSFGEKGYYRLFRGDGSCGINSYVSSAIII